MIEEHFESILSHNVKNLEIFQKHKTKTITSLLRFPPPTHTLSPPPKVCVCGGGELTKGDSGEKPESVSRVSEKTLTNLISEFQKKKFS